MKHGVDPTVTVRTDWALSIVIVTKATRSLRMARPVKVSVYHKCEMFGIKFTDEWIVRTLDYKVWCAHTFAHIQTSD